jgi:beta-glucosidase
MDKQAILKAMTLSEKATLLTGKKNWWFEGVPRLGIRDFMVGDGPHGLRAYKDKFEHDGHPKTRMPATAFPSASGMASTWNKALLFEVGQTIGKECNHYEVDVILAPGVDGKRSPLGGRNFEYFSEDPMLTSELAIAYVQGAQSEGIGTSVKHYALNEQETARRFNSSNIDERTFRELYALPFERIVKAAQPLTIMGAYNKVNGIYACENHELITKLLRNEWGYQGIVISDWGGVQNKRESVLAGLDIEMPYSEWKLPFVEDVLAGKYDVALIDAAVERILNVYEKLLANPNHGKKTDLAANHLVARRVAQEAIVLLKNNGALPLHKAENIVVCGLPATEPRTNGGGSSELMPYRIEIPLEAMKTRAPIQYFPDYVVTADLVTALKTAAKVVVFTGTTPEIESEGFDRKSLNLPAEQIAFLQAVTAQHHAVIVVNSSGSSIDIRAFEPAIAGFVQTWFLGSASGEALAQILFGEISPSGKLSETFPLQIEHTPTYPAFPEWGDATEYKEGLFTGYRFFDTHCLPVQYPFGFGMSYTTFAYDNPRLEQREIQKHETVTVKIDVKNTGNYDAYETVQLYVGKPDASVVQPLKTLAAFQKIHLLRGEKKTVTFVLDATHFQTYIVHQHQFMVESGRYLIHFAKHVGDVQATLELHINSPDQTRVPLTEKHPVRLWMTQEPEKSRLQSFLIGKRKLGWWEYEEPLGRILRRVLRESGQASLEATALKVLFGNNQND